MFEEIINGFNQFMQIVQSGDLVRIIGLIFGLAFAEVVIFFAGIAVIRLLKKSR